MMAPHRVLLAVTMGTSVWPRLRTANTLLMFTHNVEALLIHICSSLHCKNICSHLCYCNNNYRFAPHQMIEIWYFLNHFFLRRGIPSQRLTLLITLLLAAKTPLCWRAQHPPAILCQHKWLSLLTGASICAGGCLMSPASIVHLCWRVT
jgi:hypothetical protein